MDYVKTFGNIITRTSENHPAAARKLIDAGLTEELVRMKIAPRREMPLGMRRLNYEAMDKVRRGLRDPERSCWTNIFAPVEILECFGLNCLSMECLSSFMSGFKIEDYLINEAESTGIAPTMCSYHKNFIGGVDSGILPKAAAAVTTSMVCDGNISTFRHMELKHGVKCFVIDIPYAWSPEAEKYVVDQLKELISLMERRTGKKFDIDELRETLRRENKSRAYYSEFLKEIKHRYYPKTMTLDLFMLFATHLDIGTQENMEFFRYLRSDIRKYPERQGKGIFWVHLMPYYQKTLQSYFNYQEQYYVQAIDMNLDYMKKLDPEHPLEALARKMILNIYNGPYERKAKHIANLVRSFESDAVINFCHWGCKQSSGGAMLLREEMQKMGVPILILDGDALDRRNSHDGQIKTRLEAFLEMIS